MKFGRTDYDQRIVDTANRIPNDEPVFFLRGTDPLAPALLLEWAKQLRLNGGDPSMAQSAELHAQSMIEWQKLNKVKTPDLFTESEDMLFIKSCIKDQLASKDIDITSLKSYLSQYYGTSVNKQLIVLLPIDLGSNVGRITLPQSLDDFQLSQELRLDCLRADIVLYCYGVHNWTVIKLSDKWK